MQSIPVIDISPLLSTDKQHPKLSATTTAIKEALRDIGFFYISHHGISEALQDSLFEQSKKFFAEPDEFKNSIAMQLAGHRWRGYFPVGGELTSGKPDNKEGIYFGQELPGSHPSVTAGLPLHGPNLWPPGIEYVEFKNQILSYLNQLTELGHVLMEGIALSLGLPREYFRARFEKDPTILFRIFNYPSQKSDSVGEWGVGEHTDYGFLTILRQDASGGLEVKRRDGSWLAAPPIGGTFVINIGDMLEYWTHGIYRATPHRALNRARAGRISLPFFFDPSWNSTLEKIDSALLSPSDLEMARKQNVNRWDGLKLHELPENMIYGDFLWNKVKKVFPDLN